MRNNSKKMSFLLIVFFCFSILCGFSNNANAVSTNDVFNSKYDFMTFGEIEQIFLEYLKENNIQLEVGTQDYTDYILEQMLGDGDKKLQEHEDYHAIRSYFARYLCALDEQQSSPEWRTTKKVLTEVFKDKTIKQIRDENLKKDALLKEMEKLKSDVQVDLSGYSPSKAVQYAHTWAKSRNPIYPDYSNDCTNFVSQCLNAGNVAETRPVTVPTGIYATSKYWYCDQTLTGWNVSTPWIRISGSNNFHDYWAPKVPDANYSSAASVSNNGDLGDVVLFRDPGTLDRWHTTIITKKLSDGTVCLSYHTTDTKDKPISELNDSSIDWSLLDF